MSNIPLTDLRKITDRQLMNRMYANMRMRSKKKGWTIPEFSKNELVEWLYKNDFHFLFDEYVKSGYDKIKMPSIDRIDDYGVYEFSNMQLITWKENNDKGRICTKRLLRVKEGNIKIMKRVWIWKFDGSLVLENILPTEAAKFIGCHKGSITKAGRQLECTLKGYIITRGPKFIPRIREKRGLPKKYLTGTELTLNGTQ